MTSGCNFSTNQPLTDPTLHRNNSVSCPTVPHLLQSADDEVQLIARLEQAIKNATAERDELREALKEQERSFGFLHSSLVYKVDSKEKELRHFLAPRPVVCDSEVASSSQTISTTAPIQSTVPAVRPVPTLIGGTAKCSTDVPPKPHSMSVGPNSTQAGSRSDTRKSTDEISGSSEHTECTVPYSTVPVDSSVHLVLARLRRAQNNCNALIATRQTELQSFTFTQNSQNGKRIMMRVRVLEGENEELANVNRTGRTARLETEIALRQRFVQDLKQTYSDMEYLVEETEAETELLGNSLFVLQHRLNFAKVTAQVLASELESLAPGKALELFQQANWFPSEEPVIEEISSHTEQPTEAADNESHSAKKDAVSQKSISPGESLNGNCNHQKSPANHAGKRVKEELPSENSDYNHSESVCPRLNKRCRTSGHNYSPIVSNPSSETNDATQGVIPFTHSCDTSIAESFVRTTEFHSGSFDSSPNRSSHSHPVGGKSRHQQSFSENADIPSQGHLTSLTD